MKMESGPGKFEGNPAYVRWLWDNVIMESDADDDFDDEYGRQIDVINLHPGDTVDMEEAGVIEDGDLDDIHAVAIWESSDGFIYYHAFSDSKSLAEWKEATRG